MRLLFLLLACLFIAACGLREKFPDGFGIYLADETKTGEEKYRPLRDEESVNSVEANIDSKFSILIYDKRISSNTDAFKVYSGSFVRNFRKNDPMKGNFPVIELKSWGMYRNHRTQIPGQFFPVKDHPDMMLWRPTSEVKPGLYYIEIAGTIGTPPKLIEPFFFNRAATVANLESSEHCVDYYQYFMDPTDRFFPCSQNFTDGPSPAQLAAEQSAREQEQRKAALAAERPPAGLREVTISGCRFWLEDARFGMMSGRRMSWDGPCPDGLVQGVGILSSDVDNSGNWNVQKIRATHGQVETIEAVIRHSVNGLMIQKDGYIDKITKDQIPAWAQGLVAGRPM